MVGSGLSRPRDYKRALVEATMQEWQKTRVGDFLLISGCLLHPDAEDGPERVKSEQLRNEASLNCAALRSRVHYVARRSLSRVEMNALRAPLTALSALEEECRHFLLDTADAFIDGRLFSAIRKFSGIGSKCPFADKPGIY